MKRLVSLGLATVSVGTAAWLISVALQPAPKSSPGLLSQAEVTAPRTDSDIELLPLTVAASTEAEGDTDPPPTLFRVSISPEARVKAAAMVDGKRQLVVGEWTAFQIDIENAAGITAPLTIESEQMMSSASDTDRDHWLRCSLEPDGPLTGEFRETRRLRLISRDSGIRTALLNVNAGQGTQDLGFRSDVLLSFMISPQE